MAHELPRWPRDIGVSQVRSKGITSSGRFLMHHLCLFSSGQTEHRHKNGMVEIHFPNGLVRVTNPRDKEVLEEWRYPDGTIVLETRAKEKVIKMPNGQKEIHTADHKRREYPDGTVKLVYTDGRTETRYCNGRIRIKDKEGQLISDSQGLTA